MPFWDRLSELFRAADESSPSAPAVHELIERSAEEVADYERWKKTLARRRLFDWINEQYTLHLAKRPTDEAVAFLDTPSSKGFVVHFHRTQYSREEITHFFHYLRERVAALDYRVQISDRRIFSRSDWTETQERHYLKPRLERGAITDVDQKFGNIMIELELRNHQAWNLRLRATVYQDGMYRKGLGFEELMAKLA